MQGGSSAGEHKEDVVDGEKKQSGLKKKETWRCPGSVCRRENREEVGANYVGGY